MVDRFRLQPSLHVAARFAAVGVTLHEVKERWGAHFVQRPMCSYVGVVLTAWFLFSVPRKMPRREDRFTLESTNKQHNQE